MKERLRRSLLCALALTAGTGVALADGDAARGEKKFEECAACHAVQADANNMGPTLHGVFFNDRDSRRDHVAVYVVRAFRQSAAPVPDHEIVAHGFFALDQLPNETTAGTRARIIEVMGGAPMTERW